MKARTLVDAALRHVRPGGGRRSGRPRERLCWRPEAWTKRLPPVEGPLASRAVFGRGLTLFHDAPAADIRLGQSDDMRREAPHGVTLGVENFTGSYLSLVADLPDYEARGLRATDIVVADIRIAEVDVPPLYARLNVRHGPNVERLTRRLTLEGGVARAEFDLGASALDHHPILGLWLDVIVEAPARLELTLLDLVLSSHPRAMF